MKSRGVGKNRKINKSGMGGGGGVSLAHQSTYTLLFDGKTKSCYAVFLSQLDHKPLFNYIY